MNKRIHMFFSAPGSCLARLLFAMEPVRRIFLPVPAPGLFLVLKGMHEKKPPWSGGSQVCPHTDSAGALIPGRRY